MASPVIYRCGGVQLLHSIMLFWMEKKMHIWTKLELPWGKALVYCKAVACPTAGPFRCTM